MGGAPHFPLSADEWRSLDGLRKVAIEAIRAYEMAVLNTMFEHRSHAEAAKWLSELASHAQDATVSIIRYELCPQSEWMGGDRFKLREPNGIPLPRGYLAEPPKSV